MPNQLINTLWGPEIINPAPKCTVNDCDNHRQHTGHYRKDGSIIYRQVCQMHHFEKYEIDNWNYKKYRKNYCENSDGRLGFYCTSTITEPNWQLDVDHVNGDHKNHNITNLHTLCKICHAYKSYLFKENAKKEYRLLTEEDEQKRQMLIEYVKHKNLRK
jgi:hypothetical protein